VTVSFEWQARAPVFFVRTNWLVVDGQRTSIQFLLDADGSWVAPPVCAAISSNPSIVPQTNLVLNALPGYYWWNLLVNPLKDQAGPVTLTLSATNYAGLGTNVTIQLEVVPPLAFDGRELDSQGLVWTTAGNPCWFNQTAVTHDGNGAAQSGATNSLLQTRVTGPGLLSFWWLFRSEPLGYYGQFLVTSPKGSNVALQVLWSTVDGLKGSSVCRGASGFSSGAPLRTIGSLTEVRTPCGWTRYLSFQAKCPVISTSPARETTATMQASGLIWKVRLTSLTLLKSRPTCSIGSLSPESPVMVFMGSSVTGIPGPPPVFIEPNQPNQ